MRKVDKNINCKVCGILFDGGKHYQTKKTCSKDCLDKYKLTDEYIEAKKNGMKKTFQEKYGADSYPQTKEFSEKIKKTLNEFSVEKKNIINKKRSESHLNINKEDRNIIINKIKNSKLEKFGDENFNNSKKAKETILKNNNGIHHLRLDENIKKSKEANLIKYGSEYAIQSDDIKNKIKNIINDKYGVDYYFSSEDYLKNKRINFKLKIKDILDLNNITIDLENYVKARDTSQGKFIFNQFNVKCNLCGNEFTTRLTPHYMFKLNGQICRKCFPIINNSQLQLKFENFLISLNVNYIRGDRSLIKPQEVDFYLPEHNLAIEVNGNYWHSETGGEKDIKYHLNKSKIANKLDIKLIHIFEDEINEKFEIIKSRIKNLLFLSEYKIYGRKCILKEISNQEKNNFLVENHIQGSSIDKYRYGLYYESKLVSVMTFGKLRNSLGNKNKDGYELMRFANKLNTNVIGAFSKLFKHFLNTKITKYIKTYADVRWSGLKPTETVYLKNGFTFSNLSRPNYWYLSKDYLTRKHRFVYTKANLIKLYNGDINKTEFELAKQNKIDKIWDCGNLVFEYKID